MIRAHILEFQVFITMQCSYNAIFCKIFPSSSFFLLTYWQDYLVNWNSHFHSVVGHLRSKNKYGPYSDFASLLTFFIFSPKFDFLIFIYYLYSKWSQNFSMIYKYISFNSLKSHKSKTWNYHQQYFRLYNVKNLKKKEILSIFWRIVFLST